jgi:hypothetical protein
MVLAEMLVHAARLDHGDALVLRHLGHEDSTALSTAAVSLVRRVVRSSATEREA